MTTSRKKGLLFRPDPFPVVEPNGVGTEQLYPPCAKLNSRQKEFATIPDVKYKRAAPRFKAEHERSDAYLCHARMPSLSRPRRTVPKLRTLLSNGRFVIGVHVQATSYQYDRET